MEAPPLPDILRPDLPSRTLQEGFQLVALRAAHPQFDVEFGTFALDYLDFTYARYIPPDFSERIFNSSAYTTVRLPFPLT
jgi:hypothetical protein